MTLVSSQWLAGNLENNDLVIIDTRPKISYMAGHIPGSVSISLEQLIKITNYGAHLVPEPDDASKVLGKAGIDSTKTVIVCGDELDPAVCRIAWTIQYMGHKNLKILDTSVSKWAQLAHPMTTKDRTNEAKFIAQIQPALKADAILLQNPDVNTTIIDARSIQEYLQGHIPNALSFPFTDGLGQNGFLFASKELLQNIFTQIPKQNKIICYCTHGHRASSLFYQLKIAGFENVAVYDGSMMDWASRRLEQSSF